MGFDQGNVFPVAQVLSLGNGCDGDFEAGDFYGQFGALPGGRVHGKPLDPLFVHSGEIRFFIKNDRGAHDSIESGARGLEDGGDIFQALSGLFLDGFPNDFSGYGMLRACARDEHEARGPDSLAVGGRRGWGVQCADDLSCHICLG